ncbi:MAG: PAS domain S-box protein [Caldilineaceae bacterium]|nr:PAS domain S-box protein [Caldilineaceae bacterium]
MSTERDFTLAQSRRSPADDHLLLAGEDLFRLAFEHAAFAVALVSAQGEFLRVNPFACRLFGYAEPALLRLSFQSVTHPDDLHVGLDLFRDLVAGRRDHAWLEKRYIHRDGHVIWAVLSTAAVRDDAGATLYLVSQIQDVSERKAAEARLAEREAQYRGIFEATSDGLCICDLDGRIVQANPAFVAMHGYARHEVLHRRPTRFIHPTSVVHFDEALRTIRAGTPFQAQAEHVRKDGTVFPVDVRVLPFTYRAAPHMLAIVRDVTELLTTRRLLEARVAARTRELSALYDVTAVASASLELQTVLDQSLARIVELMRGECASVLLSGLLVDHVPQATWHKRTAQTLLPCEADWVNTVAAPQVLATGAPLVMPVPLCDARAGLAADYPRALIYGGVPLQAKGRTLGVLGVLRAATHGLSREETALLAAIGAQLGVAVDNARLYRQAEQLAVMEERQRLARELHDSVTQTLYSANLLTETGRRAAHAQDTAGAATILARVGVLVQDALKEMRLLVYELRPPELEEQGLAVALRRRLDAVESRTGIKTHLEADGPLQLAPVVEEALYRIALEALNNALKHADASTVTVTLATGADGLRLAVTDDGRGMATSPGTGTGASATGGMGMLTMRERAEGLGARLAVTSSPGQGTCVEVLLSREQTAAATDESTGKTKLSHR